MEKELFALLRLGVGNSTIEEEILSDFIVMPAKQWVRIGELAQKQGVLGVFLDGVEKLSASGYGATRELPVELKLEWIGEVLQIEQSNQQQKTVMNALAEKWSKEGCRTMVFKGQANGTFYPKPEHRSPGDIDCYLINDNENDNENSPRTQVEAYKRGNEIAREAGADVDEGWYKHSQIHYKGEMFENHQYFVHTRDGKRGKRLNRELVEQLRVDSLEFRELPAAPAVVMPPVQWNAMFLTYHACAHFVSEGLRLKQILDWAMFLKAHQSDVDWGSFYGFCERNHLTRFADAMNHIAANYIGVQIANPVIVKDSPYAERILENALYEEDYVFGSGDGSWHNRWHLVRNLFHYRWKYEEIYETSPWKQLWWYATGFLFKTE